MKTAFLYNDIFRGSDYGKKHPVTINRVTNVYDLSKILDFDKNVDYINNDLATIDELSKFHDADYLHVLKSTEEKQFITKELAKKYNLGTADNPIFKEMFRRHAAAAGALLLATKLIKSKYNRIFSPGSGAHHAKQKKASGFCYLNDIAICILELQRVGFSKILYLDMDAHYGDGVIEYFRDDSKVLTISTHQENLWPKHNIFEFDKKGKVVNIPLKKGFNDEDFIELFNEDFFYPYIVDYRPEVILLQMGADCLQFDKYSDLNLSNNSMVYVIKKMKELESKIVVMGGGGYNPWITLRAWIYNLAILAEFELPKSLSQEAKKFLRNIEWKEEPKEQWLNTIIDKPNIFER
ncbi:MAG: hypothetical protein CMP24_01950 [Rickettsiales bacterium]|nr:hypothetical protein [Rickettsiales bacterium]